MPTGENKNTQFANDCISTYNAYTNSQIYGDLNCNNIITTDHTTYFPNGIINNNLSYNTNYIYNTNKIIGYYLVAGNLNESFRENCFYVKKSNNKIYVIRNQSYEEFKCVKINIRLKKKINVSEILKTKSKRQTIVEKMSAKKNKLYNNWCWNFDSLNFIIGLNITLFNAPSTWSSLPVYNSNMQWEYKPYIQPYTTQPYIQPYTITIQDASVINTSTAINIKPMLELTPENGDIFLDVDKKQAKIYNKSNSTWELSHIESVSLNIDKNTSVSELIKKRKNRTLFTEKIKKSNKQNNITSFDFGVITTCGSGSITMMPYNGFINGGYIGGCDPYNGSINIDCGTLTTTTSNSNTISFNT